MAELKRVCPKCFMPLYGRVCSCGFVGAPGSDYAMALPNYVQLNERYILLQVIGAGGFGVTYKALDKVKRRICAVKEYMPVGVALRRYDGWIYPDVSEKAEIFAHGKNRFMEEAFFLQKLNAMPATATITDCFEENGTAYFVMEYVEGATIKQQVMRRGPFSLPDALNIVMSVALALHKIHTQAGMFHRDISPENIMLQANGNVKILDFGSAKLLSKQAHQNFTVVVKSGYAPPEQYSSTTPQGAYTDVYALASTFYYMVTGEKIPPALDRINGKEFVPLSRAIQCPGSISDTVDRALRLNRQERTANCGQFAKELYFSVGQSPSSVVQAKQPDVQKKQSKDASEVYLQINLKGKWRKETLQPNKMYCVGRNRRCDVVISGDMMLSNQHLYLYYDSGKKYFAIKDISRNGVTCNGQRLVREKFYYFRPGTEIKLAGVCEMTLIARS
ncbi:MAG: protein kinase [Oscillospiraceae bacterium]|nr:protein kinase [Oscillospiraceae bacterium]